MEATERRRLLIGSIDLSDAPGLEFGPLDRPIVQRSDSEVRYVDHLSTDDLRTKYRDHRLVDTARLCEVDFVLDGSPLRELAGTGYGYVIASHVAEHVPDLVGWLGEIAELLRPGGTLVLALPDMRTTFDVGRPLTLPSDLLGAHLERRRSPTVTQVCEHTMFAMRSGEQISWATPMPRSELEPVHDLGHVMEQARCAAAGEHVDVHCWVFTPDSFATNVEVLRLLGLTDFELQGAPRSCPGEFMVQLRLDPAPRSDPRDVDWDRIVPGVGDSLAADAANAREELLAIQASKSWRLTSPLRRLSPLLRRSQLFLRSQLRRLSQLGRRGAANIDRRGSGDG